VDDSGFSRGWRWFWERAWRGRYGDFLANQAKQIQLTKIKFHRTARESANKGVIVNDQMLKFHEKDRREYYKKEWEEKIGN
jgi:hypothetical protein